MATKFKTLEKILNSGDFAITAEIPPPVSAGPLELESKISLLKGSVHAINLTDNAGANAHMSSLAAASIVLNKGIDPIYQITCRDRNRLAIQSDLMGASALGIRNVLALGGDPIKSGNQPDAKAVFDVNSKTVLNKKLFAPRTQKNNISISPKSPKSIRRQIRRPSAFAIVRPSPVADRKAMCDPKHAQLVFNESL